MKQWLVLAGFLALCLGVGTAMWLAIAATIFAFAMKSRLAAFLMVPYLCWVSFAGALNAAIFMMN